MTHGSRSLQRAAPIRKRYRCFACALILLGYLLAACTTDDAPDRTPSPAGSPTAGSASPIPDRPLTQHELPILVAVTLPIFEQFVREAGRENVEVISLIPSGANPHDYTFTPADLARLEGIDFFFVNGAGLDARLAEAIEANRGEDAFVIPFAPNIRSPEQERLTAEEARDNPHLWLDPSLAYVYTEIAADEFIIYDGVREAFYSANFNEYRDHLIALQQEISAKLQDIPPERRKLVTYHDAFPHFARRFDFQITAFAVEEPGDSPAPPRINDLAETVRLQSVPAVFAEFGYDAGPMRQLADAAGAPLCTLYSDILPPHLTSYEDAMRANADELVRCLGRTGE